MKRSGLLLLLLLLLTEGGGRSPGLDPRRARGGGLAGNSPWPRQGLAGDALWSCLGLPGIHWLLLWCCRGKASMRFLLCTSRIPDKSSLCKALPCCNTNLLWSMCNDEQVAVTNMTAAFKKMRPGTGKRLDVEKLFIRLDISNHQPFSWLQITTMQQPDAGHIDMQASRQACSLLHMSQICMHHVLPHGR